MNQKNIGLLVIATGKYDIFIKPLLDSVRKFFLVNHKVTVYLFTDKTVLEEGNIKVIPQEHEGWPYATLHRYHVFNKHREILSKMDYLYYCDVDMLFVDNVGEEVLGSRVAVLHPGYYQGNRGTYETNPISTAYVPSYEGSHYFAGGFNGGSSEEFLNMSRVIERNIEQDKTRGNYIAVWHDESHLNKYLIQNTPTLILPPSYCYPESWDLPFDKRLIALDKNHREIRLEST